MTAPRIMRRLSPRGQGPRPGRETSGTGPGPCARMAAPSPSRGRVGPVTPILPDRAGTRLHPGRNPPAPRIPGESRPVKTTDTAAELSPVALTDAAVEELKDAVAGGGYWSPDLAPVPP